MANFLKKNFVGMGFSSKGIVIVQQSSGKIKNQLSLPYPVKKGSDAGVLSDDIFDVFKNNEIELAAFLQKAIRDSRIDADNVVVALPSKDLIVRFFEMPNIPKSEVLAGINFEMKKYIPFKIEELVYDFQYHVKQKANIIEVVLCGMKQAPLERYVNLFKQFNLNVAAYEPSIFSFFRLLVARNKISNQQSYVILEFDKEEANILIVEKGFPYFTRDIKLVSGRSSESHQEEFDVILFRLINEVRVSLDYYRRQFLKRDIDELILVANEGYSGWTDNFNKDLNIKVNYISHNSLLGIKDAREDMLSDVCKGFGASLRIDKPSLITLNLGKFQERQEKISLALSGVTGQNLDKVFKKFLEESKSALIKAGFIGLLIIIIGYGMGFSKLFPLERELASVTVRQMPLLPGVDVSTLDGLQSSENILIAKERDFRTLINEDQSISKKLITIARVMPAGVWLNSLSYDLEPKTIRLTCSSYADTDKERSDNVNKFLSGLKRDEDFSNELPSIELKSYREVNEGKIAYLQFEVTCSEKRKSGVNLNRGISL